MRFCEMVLLNIYEENSEESSSEKRPVWLHKRFTK